MPVVLPSLLSAALAAHAAMALAWRMRTPDRTAALAWGLGAALVLGSGLWGLHVQGLGVLERAEAPDHAPGLTLLSWLAAVGGSGLALAALAGLRATPLRLAGGTLGLGLGLCATQFLGLAALCPPPPWEPRLAAGAALVGCAAAAVVVILFLGVERLPRRWLAPGQAAAALLAGLALGGAHYAALAAVPGPAGAACAAEALDGRSLGAFAAIGLALMLVVAWLACLLEARLRARTQRLARSLQQATAQLRLAGAQLERADVERRRLALLDPLTGVANLALFENRLSLAAARVERRQYARPQDASRLAVLCIDVDGFKPVNDGWGHATGDQLLRQVAARLSTLLRRVDTVARLGGDEFVLLLEDLGSLDEAVAVAQRVLQAVAEPFELPERRLTISCSVGIALFPDHAGLERLLATAETAMHSAKRAGGGGWRVFEPDAHRGMFEVVDLQNGLRAALGTAQLQLHYQPKVDARDGRLVGVEALLRWTHPARGPVSPGDFIPVAERFGLIVALGDWVLDAACRQIAAWAARGWPTSVAVNFSGHQLRQADMAERVRQALQRHGAPAQLLVCEVTESVAMENTAATQRVIAELHALGVKLSIDDFGTGYSSLSSLRQLQAQELKIDRSFVRDVASDADARAVVDAVVRLAHALGLRVVAEGVETEEQRRTLLALHCDQLQGFHFARPMPAQALEDSGRLQAAAALEAAGTGY